MACGIVTKDATRVVTKSDCHQGGSRVAIATNKANMKVASNIDGALLANAMLTRIKWRDTVEKLRNTARNYTARFKAAVM